MAKRKMQRKGKAPPPRISPIDRYFCDALRRFRQAKGMSVKELVQLSGIPQGSLTCLETGRYRISLENLVRACLALGLSFADFWPMAARKPSQATPGALQAEAGKARALLPRLISVEDVISAVCEAFGVSAEVLRGKSRKADAAAARECLAALVKEQPHLALKSLAGELGCDASVITRRRKSFRERSDPETLRRAKKARRLLAAKSPRRFPAAAASPSRPKSRGGFAAARRKAAGRGG